MIFPAAASQNIVTCICRGHPVCDCKIIVCFLLVNLFAGESRKLRIQAKAGVQLSALADLSVLVLQKKYCYFSILIAFII